MKDKSKCNTLTLLTTPCMSGGTPAKLFQLVRFSDYNIISYFYSEGHDPAAYDEYFQRFAECAQAHDGRHCRQSFFKVLKEVLRIVDENDVKVIHSYFSFDTAVCAAVKMLRPKVKFVVSFVGCTPIASRLKRFIVSTTLRFADSYIYVSKNALAQKFEEFPFLRKRRFSVVYNGADERGNMHALELAPGFRCIMIGGLLPRKNMLLLVEMMRVLVHEMGYKGISLVTIGDDGKDPDNVRELIKQYDLSDYVGCIGYHDDVGGAYAQSQVCLHSAHSEAFGISVAEAMFAGLPVIGAAGTAMPELIEEGVTGYILPLDDPRAWAEKVAYLYDHGDVRAEMGRQGRLRAEKCFSVERFIAEHDAVYDQVLE